ncbi:hypothetical protein Rhe02_20340 [Rhizocola hellebori]|uniref:Uncharacterized protein n=1 Tax=Rhizocola hellebori TaxID=1392758 RepID=A0A8J3Q636_9ACTN|nr:hypothetical protein [Rhizocola hellebori]GIH03967.1 hypothetical protein Rhe02_20340 [Rhizocola hellebori]
MLIRLLGIVLGAVAAWQFAQRLPLGRGYALAGPVFAAVLLCTALLAQRFAPRPAAAGPRSASLTIRRIRDYLPRFPAYVAGISTVLLVLLLVGTTTAGGPDSEGRLGRAFTRVCGEFSTTNGPWPGSYYSIPILTATGVCLVLTLIALQAVARRPRLPGDEGTRRRAAEVIVSGYGIAVLTPLAGCAALTVNVISAGQCGLHRLDALAVAAGTGVVLVGLFWIYVVSVLLFGRKAPS